jgi:hypothetical protein
MDVKEEFTIVCFVGNHLLVFVKTNSGEKK